MARNQKSTREATALDPDVDHYPELVDVFSKILEADELPEGKVERVEVYCLAGGDATYRIYPPRAEEPIIGYFPPPV